VRIGRKIISIVSVNCEVVVFVLTCIYNFSQHMLRHAVLLFWWGARSWCSQSARRKPMNIGTDRSFHLPSQELHLLYSIPSRHVDAMAVYYASRCHATQVSVTPSGWPRYCQYMPTMPCSWHTPVDWPTVSAHQAGVTNFQRLHASCAYHSISLGCTCGWPVLLQAQRVALPSPQSGLRASFEANQTCWLQRCLHEALP
jgi:hypothetical protein